MKIKQLVIVLTSSIGVILPLVFFALSGWVASGDLVHAVGNTPTFTDIGAGLVGVIYGSTAWGDYDNDGDLDILLAGMVNSWSNDYFFQVYRNDGDGFTDINAGLTVLYPDAVAWGDYDNDGDLDILVTGLDASKVYRNDGDSFTDINADLVSVSVGSAAWGDYDNDGDLDILITGRGGEHDQVARVYRNDNGSFVDIHAGLAEVRFSSAAWGDYDNDGDLDIVLMGRHGVGTYEHISKVYRNDGGRFTDINAELAGAAFGSVAWGDYDNDGDLDILLSGRVYRNDDGSFTDINAGLPDLYRNSGAWGDYDNDGDLDILFTGGDGDNQVSQVYRNDSGSFTVIDAGLTDVYAGSVAWGDYDNDGDLDLLLIGYSSAESNVSKVYRNDGATVNSSPFPPTELSTEVKGNKVSLSWAAPASAGTTPVAALTYNLYVGTSSRKGDVVSPHAFITHPTLSGRRLLPAMGNIQHGRTAILKGLPEGTYYWSVQAVDHAFASSRFSDEGQFTITPPPLSLSKQATPYDELRNIDVLTYTLTLSGPGLNVHLWDPLPANVKYVAGSVTPPATYSPTARAIIWRGVLPTDTVQVIRFQATPGITGTGSLSLSLPIVNIAWLTDTESNSSVSAMTIVNGRRVYLPLIVRSH